jgi:hypothetical protein
VTNVDSSSSVHKPIIKEQLFREVLIESFKGWLLLCKILIPVSLIVSALQYFGIIEPMADVLAPVMNFVGLPGETGIIWATALLVNIYAALATFAALAAGGLELSIAQSSVLGAMILFAHALPVEGGIARLAGVKMWESCLLRILAALTYGFLLHTGYRIAGVFQETAVVRWSPSEPVRTIAEWSTREAQQLLIILAILTALNVALWLARRFGIVGLLERLLRPPLRLLGIGESACFLIVIGLVLGITFGGALVHAETKGGHVEPQAARRAMIFLCLCHSFFEDTILMLLIGGEFLGVFAFRLAFCSLAMISLSAWELRRQPIQQETTRLA